MHGYDVGSRVAQALARRAPERVAALAARAAVPELRPPADEPRGAGRVLVPALPPAARCPRSCSTGTSHAVRAYLGHFWHHWAGDRDILRREELDALAALYARPGALRVEHRVVPRRSRRDEPARGARGPAADGSPSIALCGTRDPLFPVDWTDALHLDFEDVELRVLEDVGHFVPLQAPGRGGRARSATSQIGSERPEAAQEAASRAWPRQDGQGYVPRRDHVRDPDGGRRRNNAATPGPMVSDTETRPLARRA